MKKNVFTFYAQQHQSPVEYVWHYKAANTMYVHALRVRLIFHSEIRIHTEYSRWHWITPQISCSCRDVQHKQYVVSLAQHIPCRIALLNCHTVSPRYVITSVNYRHQY